VNFFKGTLEDSLETAVDCNYTKGV